MCRDTSRKDQAVGMAQQARFAGSSSGGKMYKFGYALALVTFGLFCVIDL